MDNVQIIQDRVEGLKMQNTASPGELGSLGERKHIDPCSKKVIR